MFHPDKHTLASTQATMMLVMGCAAGRLTPLPAANVRVLRPEDAVVVGVKVVAVLLDDGLVFVSFGKVSFHCAVGTSGVGGDVGPRGTGVSQLILF